MVGPATAGRFPRSREGAACAYPDMSCADAIVVDRLSVIGPVHVGKSLRAYAEKEGLPVSAVVARAIERQLRHAALSAFVDNFE